MSRMTIEQAASVLEDRVTKIVKAMQVLVKDAPKIADVLDEEARLKTEAFLLMHFQDTMRELALAANFAPKRTWFSLDAPMPAQPNVVRYMDGHASAPVMKSVLIAPDVSIPHIAPQPSVPQPEAPKAWRPPVGRLVGTKEPVYDVPEKPRAAGDGDGETPDPRHGGIAEAGWIDS